MITQKTIQQINNTAKVEEVIEDFVNLKRRGVNMIGLCPFHDEKTPSFTVSPGKNIYKCFGCGQGGDPVKFVMEHEGFSYPEALKYLANKYNIEIEETEDTQEQKDAKVLNDSLFIINEYAKDYFQNNLLNTTEGINIGKSYFKERGYNEATIKKFDLGYASGESKDFVEYSTRKQLNAGHLSELGLISKNGYDFFRARVMFSIHNLSGKVIAFAGRQLTNNKKSPKYINSPESEIYNKRNILYAIPFAKQPIRKEDECIIVEGYTDVITLHQGGIENTVASSGTSLTEGQIRLVKRYTNNIKIIYDGDAAGVKAALRGLDLVLEQDMNVKLVLLPENEDPDSFFKSQGTEKFKNYLKEHEQDFVIFKTTLLLKEAGNDPIQKSIVLKDVVNSIAKIPDVLKRSIYIKECSKIMDMDEQVIITATNKAIKAEIQQRKFSHDRDQLQAARREEKFITEQKQAPQESFKPQVSPDYYQEKDVTRVLLNFGNEMLDAEEISVSGFILKNVEGFIDEVDVKVFKDIFLLAKAQYEKDKKINIQSFITNEDDAIKSITIDLLSSPYEYADWEERGVFLQNQKKPEDNYLKDSKQSVLRFLLRKVERKKMEINEKIHELKKDPENVEEMILFIRVLKNLIDKRNDIANQLGSVSLQ